MKTPTIVAALALIASTCASAQPADTLSKIRTKNEIALGVRETAQPFSYLDASHQFVGYSVDLCLKVVEGIKSHLALPDLKVRMVPVASSNRIPLMANGTIDLECGTTSNTIERQKQVAFSSTIFVASTRFVSKKTANLADLNALAGKAVVATAGSSNIRQISELNAARKYGMRIAPARDFAEGFLMMETDRAAAFFLDDITLAGLVANAKTPDAFVISKTPLSVEPYALMMRKGDPSFKALVDDVLETTFSSGAINGIYAKWFESSIPPKSINMRVPMSPALQRAISHPSDSADAGSYQ